MFRGIALAVLSGLGQWDAVKLTLQVGFICPFVVIDPTDLGATIVVAQALCLTIFNLSPTQKTCLFTDVNKASVCVCVCVCCTDLFAQRNLPIM